MENELQIFWTKFIALLISLAILITLIAFGYNYVLPKIIEQSVNKYIDSKGVTAIAEGTVYKKQYIAAHTDTCVIFFSYYSQFYPEEWDIDIQRYDPAAQKQEIAHYSVDKDTYDSLKVGDHYKDPLNQTAFFEFVP